ncbi:RES family NAD+ phosphorylase [Cryobacterium zhongshanensis]|uniref:RES family NAD+ phosphorylase n=1 Tax=Cryobacterium zhongshanensis TaxID=2928153 RepID=A0AA41QYB9_9MICO|nr:RES family NAD+ phosphorylase [Cryobacterium zhongshanensis]MCI4659732.1 RES family NAD+ phosphorylase [Cryobacterium zhongshanensis]
MKVPATPPAAFIIEEKHLRSFRNVLWRVSRTEGPHALAWNELRHFGPVEEMRFDPHPPPADNYPAVGVMYAATRSYTALGEVYQGTHVIDRSMGGATIAAWIPSRELTLLDLTTNWPVLNHAAASMMMDDKANTQPWARAIFERHGDVLDGLYHQSSINNEPLVTLFSRTETIPAFPRRVSFSTLLSDTNADEIVARAKKKLNYSSL